jgi:hypothetical protein
VLAVLNILFLTFHTGLIVFNVFGWLSQRTRKWNLITQCLTLASWVGMGAYYGWGYCLCTDIHWKIRAQMGITGEPNTYIGFLIQKVTGVLPNPQFVYWLTVCVFSVSFLGSLFLNIRDLQRRPTLQARP